MWVQEWGALRLAFRLVVSWKREKGKMVECLCGRFVVCGACLLKLCVAVGASDSERPSAELPQDGERMKVCERERGGTESSEEVMELVEEPLIAKCEGALEHRKNKVRWCVALKGTVSLFLDLLSRRRGQNRNGQGSFAAALLDLPALLHTKQCCVVAPSPTSTEMRRARIGREWTALGGVRAGTEHKKKKHEAHTRQHRHSRFRGVESTTRR